MGMNADELAVRELFQDLTADQPPAPPWRYQQVRQRLVRHRWRQAAIWGAAAAVTGAAAAAGAVLPSVPGGGHVRPRPVPAWAMPWPDHRNGSVPQQVLNGAVTAWENLGGIDTSTRLTVTGLRKVIWYVGQTAAAGQDVIVAFEADTRTGRYLVAGLATASDVMHGQPGWSSSDNSSPWVLWDAPAPARRPGLAIGLNIPGPQPAAGMPDNWIMVLAAPNVRTVTWTAPTSSGPRPGGAVTGRGLVIADTGQVTGRVLLTGLISGHRNILGAPRYVAVPGNVAPPGTQNSDVPQLASPPPLSPPPAYGPMESEAGQGTTTNDDESLRDHVFQRRPALFARCYGPEPLRIYLGSRLAGFIPCDNAQHELILGRAGRRLPVDLAVKTSDLTAWRFDMGSVP
jgi:hypothetical protein